MNGWYGSGYAILNSEYGAGAYKISGGASGGAVVGTNDSKVDLSGVTGYLEKFAESIDNKYVQLAGKVLGELNKIKDALDIAEHCSSSESVSLIVGYAGLTAIWGLGLMAFGLFPFFAMIGALMGIFLIGRMLAADIASCKGG